MLFHNVNKLLQQLPSYMQEQAFILQLQGKKITTKESLSEFGTDLDTFFFRSRDLFLCFLFFSVSSSALISKSLVFFNCDAA